MIPALHLSTFNLQLSRHLPSAICHLLGWLPRSAFRILILAVTASVLLFPALSRADTASNAVYIIAELINPQKLATLGPRGANPRVQKCVYWLATAREARAVPAKILDTAVTQAGYTNKLAAQLTRDALLRNLDIAGKLGCLDAAGLADMRKGQSPTVRTGPYTGQELSVDHIIPRAVCPELDCVIANLELMPLRMNESKNAHISSRQVGLAQDLYRAHLLPPAGLTKVQTAAR